MKQSGSLSKDSIHLHLSVGRREGEGRQGQRGRRREARSERKREWGDPKKNTYGF